MTQAELELLLARKMGRALSAQERRILELLEQEEGLTVLHSKEFWDGEDREFPFLYTLLAAGAALGVATTGISRLAPPIPSGTQTVEEIAVERSREWARRYALELIKGLNDRTRIATTQALDQWFAGGLTRAELEAQLAPLFGQVRAQMIGVTETTRAVVAGQMETAKYIEEQGFVVRKLFVTSQDDRVCPICSPLDGKPIEQTGEPPVHVNCRCGVALSVDESKAAKVYVTPEQLDEKLAAIQPGPPGPAGPPGPPGEPGKPAEAKVVERVVETVKVVEQPVELPEMGPKDVLVGGQIRPLTLDDLPPLPQPIQHIGRRGGGKVPHTHTKFGNDSDYIELSTDGELSLNGGATVWDDIRVPVTSTRVAGVSDPVFAAIRKNTGGTSLGVYAYKFVPTAGQNSLHFAMQVPHNYKLGSAIEAHVHWTAGSDTTTTDSAIWGLEYSFADIGEAFPVTATLTTTDYPTAVEFEHQLADLGTFAGSSNVSAILLGRVYYSTTSTLGAAWLTEVDFHYEIDSLGSRSELEK